jgi:hypothetical protein
MPHVFIVLWTESDVPLPGQCLNWVDGEDVRTDPSLLIDLFTSFILVEGSIDVDSGR